MALTKFHCLSHVVDRGCCVCKETCSLRPHTVANFHGDNLYACMYASCTQQCSYIGLENMALEQENGDRDYESDRCLTAGISADL